MDILVQATGKILVLWHVAGAGPGCPRNGHIVWMQLTQIKSNQKKYTINILSIDYSTVGSNDKIYVGWDNFS